MQKRDKKIIIFIAILVLVGIGVVLYRSKTSPSPYDVFAKCLTQKNVIMYGTWWCPHCQNQKKLFGSSFTHVHYVECADPANPNSQKLVCDTAGVKAYPTWVFADGTRIEGEASFATLKDKTNCALP